MFIAMNRLSTIFAAAIALGLTGCASEVKPAYVSPVQYQSFNCEQLHAEYARIDRYIEGGVSAPSSPSVGVGIGGGVSSRGGWGFGPSVSFGFGQERRARQAELARVLGEQEAIAVAAGHKGCPITVTNKKH